MEKETLTLGQLLYPMSSMVYHIFECPSCVEYMWQHEPKRVQVLYSQPKTNGVFDAT